MQIKLLFKYRNKNRPFKWRKHRSKSSDYHTLTQVSNVLKRGVKKKSYRKHVIIKEIKSLIQTNTFAFNLYEPTTPLPLK